MKYKKRIATGAIAFSFLVSGSRVFASTPEDLGIKSVQGVYQKQSKDKDKDRLEFGENNKIVGVVYALTEGGFALGIRNLRTKSASSADVWTSAETVYSENGMSATVSSLSVGRKVVVVGGFDKVANIMNAKTISIVAGGRV